MKPTAGVLVFSFLTLFTLQIAFAQSPDSSALPVIFGTYVIYITRVSAELLLSVVPKSNNAYVWFEWGITTEYGNATPEQPVTPGNSDPYGSYALSAPLPALTSKTVYHFRAVARNDSGTVYGPDRAFITWPPDAATLPPDSGTKTSIRLNGLCNPNGLRTVVYFAVEIPQYVFYLSTPLQVLEGDSTPVPVSAVVSGLTPSTTYYARLLAYNADYTAVTARGAYQSATTLADSASRGMMIPFTITSVTGEGRSLYFGVHTYATPCFDPALGEATLPPLPPGGFDVRLTGRCLQLGTYYDFRPYVSPSQADTYAVRFQMNDGGYPVTFTWPDLNNSYSGPVELTSLAGSVDMKSVTNFVVADSQIQNLRIIAHGPMPKLNTPNVITSVATLGGVGRLDLQGRIYPNGNRTSAWFEWGRDTTYGNETPAQDVGSGNSMVLLEALLEGLIPNTVYHYRAVARNSAETAHGIDQTGLTSGVTGVGNTARLPSSVELSQNFPNPFNPTTRIRYTLPEQSRVQLKIYDLLGREVKTLVDREEEAGMKSIAVEAGYLASGIYIYRLVVAAVRTDPHGSGRVTVLTRKMAVTK